MIPKLKKTFQLKRVFNPQYGGHKFKSLNSLVYTPEVVFGQTRYAPGGFCGPRTQKDYQLVWIHSGTCEVEINDVCHLLQPGKIYLFLPGNREHFRFDPKGETVHSWSALTPSFLDRSWKRKLNQSAQTAPYSNSFQAICSAFFVFGPVQTQNSREAVNALGLALFAEFLHIAQDRFKNDRTDEYTSRAIVYMEENYADHDCSAKALKAAGCSRNALIYKFRDHLSITPARYLWKLRVEKGLAKLMQTGLTISEISDQCGFKNPFHFSRAIRQIQGASPRAIRRAAWK